MNDKHLVLGGHGFIGQHLVKQLCATGKDVRLFDRQAEPTCAINGGDGGAVPEVVVGDFLDMGDLRRALDGVSVVYHLVSVTTPASSMQDLTRDVKGNVVGTLQLLEACVEQDVDHIVFASSGGTVYGRLDTIPAPESHPTMPISPYGITKLTCEKYIHLYHHLHQLNYSILRIANPYGSGQDPRRNQGLINALLWKVHTGQPIEIWGDGSVVRDYVYVADVAAALSQVGEAGRADIFNVGSMHGLSINDVLEAIFRVTEKDVLVEYRDARTFDVPESVLDIRKIQQAFGWSPQTTLEDGIQQTWAWVQQLEL